MRVLGKLAVLWVRVLLYCNGLDSTEEAFSNDDGDGSESFTVKMNSRFFKRRRDYSPWIIPTRFKCQI